MKRIRYLLVVVIFGAFLGTGHVQPVAAANTNVKACFQYSTGAVYSNKPLFLYKWNGTTDIRYRTGKTGDDGCGTFYIVPANNYYYFQAYWTYNVGYVFVAWNGYTDWKKSGDGGTYEWGTYTVDWQYLNF